MSFLITSSNSSLNQKTACRSLKGNVCTLSISFTRKLCTTVVMNSTKQTSSHVTKKPSQVFFPNLSFMSAQVLVAQIVQGTSVNAKDLSLSSIHPHSLGLWRKSFLPEILFYCHLITLTNTYWEKNTFSLAETKKNWDKEGELSDEVSFTKAVSLPSLIPR